MTKILYVLLVTKVCLILAVKADLFEIIRLQNQLKNSYNDIEKLQIKYKTKIKEAIMMEKENTAQQDSKTQNNDELIKCREKKEALEVLNKMYAEQIVDLKNKAELNAAKLAEKDLQIGTGLETISTYITIINDQSKQIDSLKEDVLVQIQHMESKAKDIVDKFQLLEDLSKRTKNETEGDSCLAFGNSTDIHLIKVDEGDAFSVPCESRLAGSGWTVIQRRLDGSEKFYRDWREYKEGFGNLSGEFFIGLEKLHRMTRAKPHELYVHLTDFNNESSHAFYDNIVIAGESEEYELTTLGEYSGNAGDAMRDNEHQKFTTLDRDNDASVSNCAQTCLGGWWYNKCGLSNLNGQYSKRDEYYDNSEYGIYWDEWQGPGYTLQSVQMMIRPKSDEQK